MHHIRLCVMQYLLYSVLYRYLHLGYRITIDYFYIIDKILIFVNKDYVQKYTIPIIYCPQTSDVDLYKIH